MNIEDEIQDIIDNNNTAQEKFEYIISLLQPDETREIKVAEELYGELDLSALEEQGFNRIQNIHFIHGKITNIEHIPKTLIRLYCADNLLTKIEGLPAGLIELHIHGNHINTIDLTETPNLKILNVSNNDLADLTDLPESLTQLYCHDNHISQLDLESTQQLEILHCSNNKLMVIQNVPKSLRELKMENNPMAEIKAFSKTATYKKTDITNKIDYIESIQEYYKLKSQYDKKEKQMKRSIFDKAKTKRQKQQKILAFKAPCINCKRRVGTIWSKTKQTYLAICGDSSAPCNFHIEIYSGDFFYLEDLLGVYHQEIEQYKQSIIQQKMDTLFNYISEAKSATIFKKKMDEYIAYSAIYKTLIDQYDELYNNMYKKEQLRKTTEEMYEILSSIQEMLDEYKKDGAYEVLHMAIITYKDDLMSKMDGIRRLNSEIIEINTEELKPNSSVMLDTLVKREYPLSMMEYSMSEPPKIIKFSKVE